MRKAPLFRKVNTRTRGVNHKCGGDYRHERHTKRECCSQKTRQSMHGRQRRGLDYTPLFRFLLSKVGEEWDQVFGEAVARMDRPEPIFWLVALRESEGDDYVRVGQSTYYSGLYVDAEGRLRRVNPQLGPEHLTPSCACCTHTLNGVPFARKTT